MDTAAEDGYALLAKVIESLGDACLIVDAQSRILAANSVAQRLYAHERVAFAALSLHDLCAEDQANILHGEIAASNGRPRTFHSTHLRSDGSPFSAEISIKRIDELPPASLLLLIRPREEERCGGDLELHSLLLQNVFDAVVAHTLNGELLYANQQALDQWQCHDVSEMRSYGRFGWIPPEQRALIGPRMESLRTRRELRFESHGTRGPSGFTYAEVYAKLIDTPRGPVVVSAIWDVSERVQTEEMVRYLAYHDTLTGLANRVLLGQELAHAISLAERHHDIVGLIFIDLDSFKPINDELGHAAGDDALREIANRISGCIRESDTVARLGGDEFVVVLPRLNRVEDLHEIAKKLSETIAEPMELSDQCTRVTATVGIALYRPGEDADAFMTRADLAMYEARRTGVPGWDLPLE